MLLLPLITFTTISIVDCYAVWDGLSVNTTKPTDFQQFILNLNFIGAFLALIAGDLLAHADDPVQRWNLFLFCAGGVFFWTTVAVIVGFCLDQSRKLDAKPDKTIGLNTD